MPHPPRPPQPVALPRINAARCTGCGWCVAACPPHVLSLHTGDDGRKTAVLHNAAGCTGCAQCAVRCLFGAVRMGRGVRSS